MNYGSIYNNEKSGDTEKIGKSYTQIEYEMAISDEKPALIQNKVVIVNRDRRVLLPRTSIMNYAFNRPSDNRPDCEYRTHHSSGGE